MATIRTFCVLSLAGSALAFAAPSAMADSPADAGTGDGAPLVGDFEGPLPVDSPGAPPLSPEDQRDAPAVGDFEGPLPVDSPGAPPLSPEDQRGAPLVGDFEGTPGVDDSRPLPASEGDPLPGGDPVAPRTEITARMVAANSTYRISYRRAARHHHRHGHGHGHHRGAY